MGIRRRVRKVLAWGLFLVVAILVGGGLCAYFYAMDSDNLVALVEGEAPRFLPDCKLTLSRVRVRPFAGEITLNQATLRRDTGGPAPTLVAMAPWLQIRYDPWASLTEGKFLPREVVVAQPLIRLRKMKDGAWNVEGLLADPFPIPMGGATPPITIQRGTVELAGEDDGSGTAILRDVSVRLPAGDGGPIAFEMTARGDLLDRVRLDGTFDPASGRLAITKGDLARLSLSGPLRERLPETARKALDAAGLEGGELDVTLARLGYDPSGSPRLTYDASARLRRGAWKCPKLPFPIGDVSVDFSARDGVLTIDRAEGRDGSTTLTLAGRLMLDDPMNAPFEVHASATNLELDKRLRRWTPEKFAELWDVYFPKVGREPSTSAGKVDVAVSASRKAHGAEIASVVEASCNDVSMEYIHFKYPLDHVRGTVKLEGKRMTLDLSAPVGDRPLRMKGTVDDPGPDAVAKLDFWAESLPIDAALFKALPPEVRKVVDDFRPSGSGRGHAHLERLPPLGPDDDPRGRVAFDAWIDLNPGCSITWEGLKYPVMNLTGKLEIHPKLWIFSGMKGSNGQATISAGGRVDEVAPGQVKVKMRLEARNLPFDQQLRDALPPAWQVTWKTLNPTGASDIDADIEANPGHRERYRVQITPKAQTGVKLQFDRPAPEGGDGGPTPIEMRMDDVTGRFVFDTARNPPTEMTDVAFTFQGAPVRFGRGVVSVQDNGKFNLGVTSLEVQGLRLDERLRRQMPPMMATMARRLDDRKIPLVKGDLGLGWSGMPGESAWCHWQNVLVVLVDNKVDVGADYSLDHIQGQIDQVNGKFDGTELEVHGKLNLDSLSVFGQQVTRLGAKLDVAKGWASLTDIEGVLLGGRFGGSLRSSLDATPKYEARMSIHEADLRAYAFTVPGHQPYRGLVSGRAVFEGQGYDPHAIQAEGKAWVEKGDLGRVPSMLVPFFALLSLNTAKTAFDSAEVTFRTRNGETVLNPVRIVGNALTLHGQGTLDVQGNLNLRLPLTYGRDSWKGPLLDILRKTGGQILVVRVQGPLRSPTFSPELVPIAGETARAMSRKDGEPKPGTPRR